MSILSSNIISDLAPNASREVVSAIHQASSKTGVDFAYLLQQAKAESSFQPEIKAKTSSATGLYQFIDKTWLSMVRDHGHKYGLGEYAAQIDGNGRVADKALKQEILALRKDPAVASSMAAEFAADNKAYLERYLGPQAEIGGTELYFAHFLGAGKAAAFLKTLEDNPFAKGADMLPKAAAANKNVFYKADGEARSVAEIYAFFDKKFNYDGGVSPPTRVAEVTPESNPVVPQPPAGSIGRGALPLFSADARATSEAAKSFSMDYFFLTQSELLILAQLDNAAETYKNS